MHNPQLLEIHPLDTNSVWRNHVCRLSPSLQQHLLTGPSAVAWSGDNLCVKCAPNQHLSFQASTHAWPWPGTEHTPAQLPLGADTLQ